MKLVLPIDSNLSGSHDFYKEKYCIELKILLVLQSSSAQSVQLKECSQIQLQWFCAGNLNLLASCFVVAQITFCTLHLSYT